MDGVAVVIFVLVMRGLYKTVAVVHAAVGVVHDDVSVVHAAVAVAPAIPAAAVGVVHAAIDDDAGSSAVTAPLIHTTAYLVVHGAYQCWAKPVFTSSNNNHDAKTMI